MFHVSPQDGAARTEMCLVADSLRLGGAILKHYPEMLAAQLLGRFGSCSELFCTVLQAAAGD